MPGDELAEPVRVVVRNGGLPVVGAPVRFTAQDGGVRPAGSGLGLTSPLVVMTGADGVAAVNWLLDPAGNPTQTLVAQRLDDLAAGLDVQVIVTGRLSIASQVQWTPACSGFDGTRTVQDALGQLVQTPMLRLLGGDGQEVTAEGLTVPRHVRVVVDSPCGPVKARVQAVGTDSALVLGAAEGDLVPPTLVGTGATQTAEVITDAFGVATFVWQPGFKIDRSDTLSISLVGGSPEGAVRVHAQLDPPAEGKLGMHVLKVLFGTEDEFENDDIITIDELSSGIFLHLDRRPLAESVKGKPIGRVLLDVQWPLPPESDNWHHGRSFGYQRVELFGEFDVKENILFWVPDDATHDVLTMIRDRMISLEADGLLARPALPIRGRFQIDGWAVIDERDPSRHLNGAADRVSVNGQTVLALPTNDDLPGGRFEMWFGYGARRLRPPFRRFIVEDFIGATLARTERLARDAELAVLIVEEDAPGVRRNTVLGTVPAAGSRLMPGQSFTIRVARGAGR